MTRLPPPEPTVRACVVVPAHNEAALIGDCLRALADQRRRRSGRLRGDPRPRRLHRPDPRARPPDRRRTPLPATPPRRRPRRGAGAARKLGMDLASSRLLSLGRPTGLIASTDADSTVAPDWLRVQLDAVAAGAHAIGGRVELFPADAAALDP